MMETKHYTKYKYTKIPLIDEIPTNWTLGRVKNILDYTHYYPIGDGDHGSIKPDMYLDKGVPYIRVQNLSWNFDINYENLVYISQKLNKENRKSILKPGDILIAKTGATVGKMAIIPQKITEANTTSSVGKITINKEKYNNKYFAYLFLSYIFRQQIIETAFQKSAQPGFNIDDLIEFKILIPPKNEQEQIAKYLDTKTTKIEQTITKNKKLITLLKEKRDVIINNKLYDKKYEKVKLKDVLKIGGYIRGPFGSSLKRDELKFEGIPVYEQQHAIHNSRNFRYYVDNKKYHELLRFKTKTNDLIISCSGTVGKISIIKNSDPKGIISQALLILRADGKKITPKYLNYYLISPKGNDMLISESDGTAQINISSKDVVNKIPLYLPPINIQKEIIKYLDNKTTMIDKTIEKIEKNIELLEEYRESLIHHVVTGKIDVRGVEV